MGSVAVTKVTIIRVLHVRCWGTNLQSQHLRGSKFQANLVYIASPRPVSQRNKTLSQLEHNRKQAKTLQITVLMARARCQQSQHLGSGNQRVAS